MVGYCQEIFERSPLCYESRERNIWGLLQWPQVKHRAYGKLCLAENLKDDSQYSTHDPVAKADDSYGKLPAHFPQSAMERR